VHNKKVELGNKKLRKGEKKFVFSSSNPEHSLKVYLKDCTWNVRVKVKYSHYRPSGPWGFW